MLSNYKNRGEVMDISLSDREILAGSTPSQDDLLQAWAAIYQAVLDDDQKWLAEAIGAHSRIMGYKTEPMMRKNHERILCTIEQVKNTTGLESALRRALGGV